MNIKTLYEQIKNNLTASNTSNEIVNAIKFILKNKTLVYFPDIRKNDILIQTLLKSIQNTEFCACIVLDNNNAKEKYIKYSNCTIVTLDIFSAMKKVYDIIIFDDIKKLDTYSKCKNTNEKVMFGTTGSPLLFYKLFALKTEFKCYTPVEDENRDRNIYKKIISNSTLVNYNDTSVFFANNKDHDIVKFYRGMKAKEKAVFTKFIENEVLCKTTLCKYFKCQFKYESEKITILKAILQIISGKKCCIIVKNSEIKTALGDIINAECDMQTSNNSTILRTYAELGRFEADIRAVIFFNFYPCNIDSTKYILCGQKDKKGLERLIAVEEAIELEVRPSIVMQNLLSVVDDVEVIEEKHAAPKVDKIDYNSLHKFTVYFDDKSGDVEKIDLDKIAKNTVLQNRCMNVWMETPNTLIASFQLSMLYDYPVSYVPTETSSYSYMPCNSFTLGHVNQYNSFVPIEQFKGMGFVFLQSTISIFLFSRKANIRIEIEPKHLEKQLFVNFNASRILLYITTKIPQKVYVVKYVDIRKYEAIKNCLMNQKYELVDELNWQRITANELSAFGKYFDLCLTVNLEQLSKKYRASDLNSDQTYNKLNKIILDTKKINQSEKLNDINRYKQPIQSILNKFSSYGVSMCISQITDNSLKGKTIAEIRSELANLDFDSLYHLEILLTKKTNFINHKLTDLSIFENNDMEKLTKYLDINLKNRFVPLDGILERYKVVALNSKAYTGEKKYTKQITLTPMRFICEYPDHYDSNRILRNFDPSNFIRVYFKDEDGSLTRNNDRGENENIYQRIKHYMRTGISLGNRRFFFLAMSSSQLKLHSAWFISPYVMKNQMIGADFVRSWMGDFKEIHNIGKYAIRLGQALSTTIPTIQIVNMQVENDIERNGYVFSDGIGMISPALANEISSYLKVLNVPSAFQIRIGGFKGVVSVYKNRNKSGVNINKQKKKRLLECSKVNLHRQIDDDVVILRKSMQKFSSDHTTLEVVSFSQYTPCRLNRQVILLLEALKINTNVFLEMQDDTIAKNILKDNKPIAELGNVILKKCFSDERHVLKMKEASINKQFTDLVKKSKIFVCKGRILMGILDEYNVLGENEVFVRVSACNNCECNSTGPEVITGKVVVSKNPCLHPGDIRIVNAVDYDIFHHLIDVIVFPQRGYRPITNMCSGSDLDGDCYFCVWDERLVPNEMHDPDTYNTANLLYKEVVSIDDIINFYTRFMQGNQLGYIANAHLALSDKLDRGVLEPECIRLANLFSLGVDFPKTGYVANLPHELYPVEYPDFMESAPAYKSQKILGVLYRRCLMVYKLSFHDCECNKKASDYLQCIYDFECRNIYNLAKMKGKINGLKRGKENINQNHIKSSVLYLDNLLAKLEPLMLESKVIIKAYKDEQKLILSRNCKLNEYLAVLGPINDEDNKHSALNGIKKLNTKYKRLLHKNVANDKIYHKALAWYITAHENCAYSCTSFGWLGIDILNANINEFMKYKECCSYVTNYTSTGNKNSQKTVVDGIRAQQVLVEEFKLSKKLFIVNKNSPRIFNQSSTKDYYNYKGCRFVYCPLYFELCSQIKDLDIMKEMFAILYAIRFFTLSTMDTFIEFMSLFSTLLSKDTNMCIVIQLLIELSKFYYRVDEFIANVVKVMTEKELFDVECKDTVSVKNALLRLYEIIHGCSTEENGNKLLLVPYVLSTDHSLGIKLLACENIFFTQSQNKKCTLRNEMKIAKSNKRIELAIIGMFDYSDMIYMEKYDKNIINIHKNHQKYVPLLLNPGKSTYLNYKDELRMFLVNNVWTSRKNNIFIKVRILPGKLYFYNIPNRYSNNNFELKTLVNDLNSVIYDKNNPDLTINSYFLNDIFFVSTHKNASSYVKQKVIEELLFSVMKDGISYFVHYSLKENKVYMVTKNKSFAYAFTLIDSTDVQFNTTHEEIIYSIEMGVNDLTQDEMILLTLGLSKGNDDTLQLSNNVKFFTQLKLYFITSTSYVKDANTKNDMRPCIQLMKRSIYDYDFRSMEFVYAKDTNSCEAISQYKFNTVDFKTIDDFFEKTWLLYEDYFV